MKRSFNRPQGTGLNKHVPDLRNEFLIPFDSLFDKLINQAFPNFGQEFGVNFFGNSSYPRVNVIDYKNTVIIEAEIAGLSKGDVSVDYEDGLLTITGNKTPEVEEAEAKYVYRELKRSSFRRSFQLDETTLEVAEVSAEFDNGILSISIPKKESTPPKSKKVKIL